MSDFQEDHVKQDEFHIECMPGRHAGSRWQEDISGARQNRAAQSLSICCQVGLVCLSPAFASQNILLWSGAGSGISFCCDLKNRWEQAVVRRIRSEWLLPCHCKEGRLCHSYCTDRALGIQKAWAVAKGIWQQAQHRTQCPDAPLRLFMWCLGSEQAVHDSTVAGSIIFPRSWLLTFRNRNLEI